MTAVHTLTPSTLSKTDVDALDELATADVPPQVKAFLREVVDYVRSGETIYLLHAEEELTPNEAAQHLKMSRTHLCKLLDRGEIPSHKVGSHRRILVSDLVAFNRERHKDQLELAERFAHQRETADSADAEIADFL
nr:helix-turn-helix domain-containing protein [Corynebacterium aquatimens]